MKLLAKAGNLKAVATLINPNSKAKLGAAMINANQVTIENQRALLGPTQEQPSWRRACIGFASSLIGMVLMPIVLASF